MRGLQKVYSYLRRRLIGRPPEVFMRDIVDLQVRYHSLIARQNAMQAYYEQRIDLIYRQVTKVLRQVLEDQHIVAETTDAIEERYRRIFSSGFGSVVDIEQIRVGDLISGEIQRGVIASPLTFHGFRVTPHLATEEGEHIRIFADGEGVAIDGPYLRLAPGEYRIEVEISADDPKEAAGVVEIDVYATAGQRVVAREEARVDASLSKLSLPLVWGSKEASGSFVLRIHQRSRSELLVKSVTLA